MLRKIISYILILVFAHTSVAQAGSTNLSQFMNYYGGMILANSGDNYSQFTLPIFVFDDSDLDQPGWFGELTTVCFTRSGKCAVAGKRGDYYKLYVADDESLNNIRATSIPNDATVAVVKVDHDTLYRMQARSIERYEWADDAGVDDKIFSCGLGVGGCLLGIATAASGWGAIGALIVCTGTAQACANAARAMNKYEAEQQAKSDAAAAAKAASPGAKGGEGGSSGPKGGTTTVWEGPPHRKGVVIMTDRPGRGGSSHPSSLD